MDKATKQIMSAVDKIKDAMSHHKSALNIPENVDYKKMIRDWRNEGYLKAIDKRKRE